jgi:sarcosine oxidase gamma subunit
MLEAGAPSGGGARQAMTAVPVDPVRLIHLRAGRDAAAIAARLALPAASRATERAAWLGPGEWLLFDDEGDWDDALRSAGAAATLIWSDASDALAVLDLGHAGPLLARLTGLHPDSFATGRAVRSQLAGLRVTLIGRTGGLWLLFDRSLASHMRAWLDVAL